MPKVVENVPHHVRPYVFHGMDLQTRGDEAVGDCPFCGKEGKFSIHIESGKWRCLVCAEGSEKGGGNVYTFIRLLWKASDERTKDYAELVQHRKLDDALTLMSWGVCKSAIRGDWLVPGFGIDGKLTQLYRYVRERSGRWTLLATPGLAQALHGINLYDKDKPTVYVCEGPWDAMALWETLRKAKSGASGLVLTGNPESSLQASANVVAVPGCQTFFDLWAPFFAGKHVVFMYDSDRPRTVRHEESGVEKSIPGAGLTGTRRAVGLLAKHEDKPQTVRYLKWGDHGFDPDLPDGFDVRDALAGGATGMADRVAALGNLLARIEPVPPEWIPGRTAAAASSGSTNVATLPCREWKTLHLNWRKALKWTEGLDRALSVMLASVTSTCSVGDQLWVKIIGPASCGKSELCEALSVNLRHVVAKSTIRGFHSGFISDREGKEDNSLLAILGNKTLVTKDGDTLLQSPNLDQILAEGRDIYDRVSRTHYRTGKASRDYLGFNMTWILCGTSSLRALDSSELGERFLDCIVVDEIDDELEDEIALRKAFQAEREIELMANGSAESRDGPEKVRARQLTGGYIDYLKANSQQLYSETVMDDEAIMLCTRLGKFVAFLRARPSKKQEEEVQRELCYRLVSQLVRLAKSLAVVLNRPSVDEEVMRRVRKTALDTARGRTFQLVKHLYRCGPIGAESSTLARWTNHNAEAETKMLVFLSKIGAVERFQEVAVAGVSSKPRWRLTDRLTTLYQQVAGE